MRVLTLCALALVWLPLSAVGGPYEDCILQNMKGVSDRAAAFAVKKACEVKTTPAKCRDQQLRARLGQVPAAYSFDDLPTTNKPDFSAYGTLAPTRPPTDREVASAQKECISECAATSWWSRTFGECKTD